MVFLATLSWVDGKLQLLSVCLKRWQRQNCCLGLQSSPWTLSRSFCWWPFRSQNFRTHSSGHRCRWKCCCCDWSRAFCALIRRCHGQSLTTFDQLWVPSGMCKLQTYLLYYKGEWRVYNSYRSFYQIIFQGVTTIRCVWQSKCLLFWVSFGFSNLWSRSRQNNLQLEVRYRLLRCSTDSHE